MLDDQIIRQRMITHSLPENRAHTRIIAACEADDPASGSQAMERLMAVARAYLNSC